MPIVHIHMVKGRPVEKKRALVSKIAKAISETIDVDIGTVTIFLHEAEVQNVGTGGVLLEDKYKPSPADA